MHRRVNPFRQYLRRIVLSVLLSGIALAGVSQPAFASDKSDDRVWDKIAKCESGNKWNTATGNGYYGGLQFSKSTWKSYGGSGMPHKASRSEQIKVAKRVLKAQGWKAWPACTRKLGLR